MTADKSKFVYSIFWNCGLIAIGTLIQAIALKSVAIPHNFVPGGLSGVGSLIYYKTGWLNPGLLYLVLNIPMFVLGYIFFRGAFWATVLWRWCGLRCFTNWLIFRSSSATRTC